MSRITRLKDELTEHDLIAELTTDNVLIDILIEEIDYALHPPVHERKNPSYGVMVVPQPIHENLSIVDSGNMPAELARRLADGTDSFAVRTPNGIEQIVCFRNPFANELSLIGLQERLQGVFVQRDSQRRVRIYSNKSIVQNDSGFWATKPYSKNVLSTIMHAVPQADPKLLQSLLLLAFHCLSSSNVGATLVWPMVDTSLVPLSVSKEGMKFNDQVIDCGDSSQFGAIRSLLNQYDGAAMLSPYGKIISLGDHLGYSDKAKNLISSIKGTRHTSAQRFSFDEARVVILVVSEEGPVSVFSDGVKLTELNMRPVGATERVFRETTPDKSDQMATECNQVDCPKCGRHYLVEVFTIYGWKAKETAECVVCGSEIYSSNCFKIAVHLRKKF
jgi:hypothetical protein